MSVSTCQTLRNENFKPLLHIFCFVFSGIEGGREAPRTTIISQEKESGVQVNLSGGQSSGSGGNEVNSKMVSQVKGTEGESQVSRASDTVWMKTHGAGF